MTMLGRGGMLLSFDIDPPAVAEHDHWHTHEHMPERLSIPGFLRGSRWSAVSGSPAYLVLYEVAGVEVLQSAPYLERLDHPTSWTQKMMRSYRGMRRGLCAVVGSFGAGLGAAARLIRFSPRAGTERALLAWLTTQVLPDLVQLPGLAGAALLRSTQAAAMTVEQQIRGPDLGMDAALLITGYAAAALDAAVEERLDGKRLSQQGAGHLEQNSYRLDYVLTAQMDRPQA
jgi:hypothetical protein